MLRSQLYTAHDHDHHVYTREEGARKTVIILTVIVVVVSTHTMNVERVVFKFCNSDGVNSFF